PNHRHHKEELREEHHQNRPKELAPQGQPLTTKNVFYPQRCREQKFQSAGFAGFGQSPTRLSGNPAPKQQVQDYGSTNVNAFRKPLATKSPPTPDPCQRQQRQDK